MEGGRGAEERVSFFSSFVKKNPRGKKERKSFRALNQFSLTFFSPPSPINQKPFSVFLLCLFQSFPPLFLLHSFDTR